MDELGAKKVAEVAAFTTLAADILRRADDSFAGAAPECYAHLQHIAAAYPPKEELPVAVLEIFETKSTRTTAKLTTMMELYVGTNWDNPTEVLEWTSFYAGAAAAHCAIAGRLIAQGDDGESLAAHLAQLQIICQQLLAAVIAQLEGRSTAVQQ